MTKTRRTCVAAGWMAVACAATDLGAAVIYVDATAPVGGSGATWSTAIPRLQDALAIAVEGDEVRVAQGVYRPGLAGAVRTVTFAVPSGVALRGGYAGLQSTTPDQRNPAVFVTQLSGDLNANDNAQFTALTDNCLHVVTLTNASEQTLVEGITLRGGAATGTPPASHGGGMFITGGAPHISQCTFTMNSASSGKGGGVALSASAARFEQCTFTNNRGTMMGGGIYTADSTATFTDCLLQGNVGGVGGGAFNQGGACVYRNCSFLGNLGQLGSSSGPGACDNSAGSTFEGCLFQNNSTNAGGGGVICFAGSTTQVRACRFIGNLGATDGGGGMYIQNSSVTVASSFFTGNSGTAGGAILVNGAGATSIINCTIINNGLVQVTGGAFYGGIYSVGGANPLIRNTILWGNASAGGSVREAQVRYAVSGSVTMDNCHVQQWTGVPAGPGVTAADPAFMQINGPDGLPGTPDDSPFLLPSSPCINAGVTDARAGVRDVLGNTRFSGVALDIGCVELQACSTADFNHDGDFGTDSDIEAFFACLAGTCCPTCGGSDFDADGDSGTDADIEAFFRVLAGGPC